MDVGAVCMSRALLQAAQEPAPERELGPMLAARVGPAPLSSFTGGPPLADDLLRAALRERALLLDLDPILAQATPEDAEQALGGGVLALQASVVREPDEPRPRRDSGSAAPADAEPLARAREDRARARFSQTQAVLAESPEDLVARFPDGADARRPGR
jgi:hypothetical protein